MEVLILGKEYVSFYQIAKEMALEEGLPYPDYVKLNREDPRREEWENKFTNYRKGKTDYFKEILENQGVNPDIKYKVNGEFQIPIEDKDIIKFLIREYTSPYYKKFRNGEKADIKEFKEIEDIINKGKEFICRNFKGEEAEKQLASLYRVTEYYSRKSSKEVYDRITKMIEKSINNIKVDKEKINDKKSIESNKKLASFKNVDDILNKIKYEKLINIHRRIWLTDKDAELLILFYEQMITNTTKTWNRLADIFNELRDVETDYEDTEDEFFELDVNIEDTSGPIKRLEEPVAVLKKSLKILNEELTEEPKVKERIEEEITEEVMKEIKDSIKSRNPDKE